MFATGSRDGHIMIWDDRCQKKGKKKNNPICELTIFLQGSLVPLRKGNCMLIQTLFEPVYRCSNKSIDMNDFKMHLNHHVMTVRKMIKDQEVPILA